VSIVAHGMGFTQTMVSLSAYPRFFKKNLHVLVGFSPVVEIDNQQQEDFSYLCNKPEIVKKLHKVLGPKLPDEPMAPTRLFKVINSSYNLYKYNENYDLDSLKSKINMGGHFPGGGSFKCFEHFRQMYFAKKFQMFDYDFEENQTKPKYKINSRNMEIYGSYYPPQYPLKNI
jgi:hypothetical protein